MTRVLRWSAGAAVAALLGLTACSESDRSVSTAPLAVGAEHRSPVVQVSDMLGGAEAFRANWQSTFMSAARGDATALAVLRGLQRLNDPTTDTNAAVPRDVPRLPSAPRVSDDVPTESYTSNAEATIISSDTWVANLATSHNAGQTSLGAYVLFEGTDATSSAEYRVSPHGQLTGDWASAGTNSSTPRDVAQYLNCRNAHDAACAFTKQQDATFRLSGVPTCDVDLSARGNHEVWYASADVSISINFPVPPISVGFTVHTPTGVHATQADFPHGTTSGVNCADEDEYESAAGAGESGGGCPDEDQYYWFHDYGSGFQLVGIVCIEDGVITIMDRRPSQLLDIGQLADISSVPAAPPRTTGQVTLAYLPGQRSSTESTILRRAHQSPSQIILVGDQTTSADLALAMGALGALRAIEGEVPSVDRKASIRGHLVASDGAALYLAQVQRYLDQVRRAPSVQIPGVGIVAALVVSLGATPTIRGQ